MKPVVYHVFTLLLGAFLITCFQPAVPALQAQNATYSNPILKYDYSDPDVIRVGDDYWMTASSFQCAPGLPILHSTDLVHWELVNYALPRLQPAHVYDNPAPGCGVWAPSLRFHDGVYYIFWGDPDYGIFRITATDPRGTWTAPQPVCEGKGMIDPCPLWDKDGRVYLVHAWAKSRAGFNGILTLREMDAACTQFVGHAQTIYSNPSVNPTIEGPKCYIRNGYYYIFAPAGGVANGWQLVLRSESVTGPYEVRRVMDQGNTTVNGPHQGGWVEDVSGQNWFLHFQEKQPFGRITHVQPMTWHDDDWCVIGRDPDGDGVGEPVYSYTMPASTFSSPAITVPTSDNFNAASLGLQWQWNANPQDNWYALEKGKLRLFCGVPKKTSGQDIFQTPNVLSQKCPAQAFTATAHIQCTLLSADDLMGLAVMGLDYATLQVRLKGHQPVVSLLVCRDADTGALPAVMQSDPLPATTCYLRVEVDANGKCVFFYSTDDVIYRHIGTTFQAREGKWIGAKVGLYATSGGANHSATSGYMEVDQFTMSL